MVISNIMSLLPEEYNCFTLIIGNIFSVYLLINYSIAYISYNEPRGKSEMKSCTQEKCCSG